MGRECSVYFNRCFASSAPLYSESCLFARLCDGCNIAFMCLVDIGCMKCISWMTIVATGFFTSESGYGARVRTNPYLALMERAQTHAKAHKTRYAPVLSPVDSSVLGDKAQVHVDVLHAQGFKVVPVDNQRPGEDEGPDLRWASTGSSPTVPTCCSRWLRKSARRERSLKVSMYRRIAAGAG